MILKQEADYIAEIADLRAKLKKANWEWYQEHVQAQSRACEEAIKDTRAKLAEARDLAAVAAVCHDFGPDESYHLEDLALKFLASLSSSSARAEISGTGNRAAVRPSVKGAHSPPEAATRAEETP